MSTMNPNMTRRAFLGASLAASGALMVPGMARADSTHAEPRRLRFFNTHTGEKADVVYFEKGIYVPDALTEIDWIMRDFRANAAAPMARGVIDLVHDLTRKLETDATVHIISGYRSPATNSLLRKTGGGGVATHSLHMDAMAIDLRIPGRDLAKVRDAARALQRGGVGFYPGQQFVHVDTGRVRQWAG